MIKDKVIKDWTNPNTGGAESEVGFPESHVKSFVRDVQ